MVIQYVDRALVPHGQRKRPRIWPTLPPKTRLRNWLERTARNSAFMRKNLPAMWCGIPVAIAKANKLKSCKVIIITRCDGVIELRSLQGKFIDSIEASPASV